MFEEESRPISRLEEAEMIRTLINDLRLRPKATSPRALRELQMATITLTDIVRRLTRAPVHFEDIISVGELSRIDDAIDGPRLRLWKLETWLDDVDPGGAVVKK
jgi:hypothetical protein